MSRYPEHPLNTSCYHWGDHGLWIVGGDLWRKPSDPLYLVLAANWPCPYLLYLTMRRALWCRHFHLSCRHDVVDEELPGGPCQTSHGPDLVAVAGLRTFCSFYLIHLRLPLPVAELLVFLAPVWAIIVVEHIILRPRSYSTCASS